MALGLLCLRLSATLSVCPRAVVQGIWGLPVGKLGRKWAQASSPGTECHWHLGNEPEG